METANLDSIIEHLSALREQNLESELQDAEIRNYFNQYLLTKEQANNDDCSQTHFYETDEDSVNIIMEHLMKFNHLINDHHYVLLQTLKMNGKHGILLKPLKDDCNMETTFKAIDELVASLSRSSTVSSTSQCNYPCSSVNDNNKKRKRQESSNESNSLPSKKIVPETTMMNAIKVEMNSNMRESDQPMKRQSEKKEVCRSETETSRNVTEMDELIKSLNSKMESLNTVNTVLQINNAKKVALEEMTSIEQKLEEIKADSNAKFNKLKANHDAALKKLHLLQKQITRNENRRKSPEINRFYAQRNLEYIRNSPAILEKMCTRLSTNDENNSLARDPPFEEMTSMEEKEKQLIEYFDLLQKNLDGSTKGKKIEEIQKSIRLWLSEFSLPLSMYEPTRAEKKEWEEEIYQKSGIENTIGTVCYMPCKWEGRKHYIFFCIANSKIIVWTSVASKEDALDELSDCLKDYHEWDTNSKFATALEVSGYSSDYFVHVSTDDIMRISTSHKVMDWMFNNFESLKYSFEDNFYESIPAIYSLALKFFEESLE